MKTRNTTLQNLAATVLSPRFLRVCAWVYGVSCAALWISLLLSFATGAKTPGQGLGPDFPAFYSAGWMVRNGRSQNLYNFEKQLEVQRALKLNAGDNDFSAWVHPPHGAWLLSPLTNFSPRAAYAIYSVFLLSCFAGGLFLLRRLCPLLSSREFNGLWILAMLSAPVYFSISAGQNTGLMFLLHVAAIAAIVKNRHANAGFALVGGLLKPHLFLAWPAFWVARKMWRAVTVFALGAIAVALISMGVFGTDVFAREWRSLQSDLYQSYETLHAYKMFSWPSFWRLLLGANFISITLGAVFALALLARTCWLWTKSSDVVLLSALSIACIVLCVPHLPVYDLGLLLIPALIFTDRVLGVAPQRLRVLRLSLLALVLFVTLGDEWARQTHFQIVVPLLSFIWWRAQSLLPHEKTPQS